MASVYRVINNLGNDKDVKKQRQTMFPTGCMQGPAQLGPHRLLLNITFQFPVICLCKKRLQKTIVKMSKIPGLNFT